MRNRNSTNIAQIEQEEAKVPLYAAEAVRQAVASALASGYSIVVADDGVLVRVDAAGKRTFIKSIPKRVKVRKNSKIQVK